jgi:hypothetical protein
MALDQTTPTAPVQSVPPPPVSGYDQLKQLEDDEQKKLAQNVGAIKVQKEQTAYQQQIDAAKPDRPMDEFGYAEQFTHGLVSGVIHASSELMNTADELVSKIPGVNAALTSLTGESHEQFVTKGNAAADALSPEVKGTLGNLAKGTAQFVTSFAATTAMAPEVEGGALLKGGYAALKGGIAQAAGFNPKDPRLSDLIQAHPALANPVTAFLASKPDDTEAEGRLKNFAEGTGLGIAGDAVISGFMSILKGMRAAGAAADAIHATAEVTPTAVEHPAPAAAPAVEHPVTHTFEPDTGEHVFETANGKLIADEVGAHIKVKRIDVAAESQGNGEGKALMDKLHEVASGKSLPIHSDGSVSPAQARVYESMGKRGAEVTQNPGATVNPETGNLITDHPNKPVFSVAPKAPQVERPWEPAAVTKENTAAPQGQGAKPGETVFNPQEHAAAFIKIPAEKLAAVRQAISDGHFNEVSGMLDDTHRTIPWDKLSDGANLKGLFNAIEEHLGGIIKDSVGIGPVSNATTAQLAADIGGNISEVESMFNDVAGKGGKPALSARITAGYNIMMASARQLSDLVEHAESLNPKSQAGLSAILAVERHTQIHAAIVGEVRGSSSEIARALQAHRSLKASTEVALNNMSDLMGTKLGPKGLAALNKALGKGSDLATVNAAVKAISKRSFGNVLKEMVQNGLVYNPKTQLTNIAGNIAGAIIGAGDRMVAGGIGAIRGVLMPSAERASMRSAVAYMGGQIEGFKSSWPLFVKAMKDEPTISAAGRPLTRQIARDTTGQTGANLALSQVINKTGTVIRYSGRTMGAIDNLNMGMGYTADLYSRSYIMAATEADAKGAMSATERAAFIDQRVNEIRQKPMADVREKAMEAGLYQSYQEAPRTRFGEPVGTALNSHPIVKLIIAPFFHRPANFLRQGIMDRTPLGLLSEQMRTRLFSGNADGDVSIARMAIGTAGLVSGWELHKQGVITGGGLGSHNTDSLNDRPAYSVKIGDSWRKIDRLEPLGTWLSIAADFGELVDRHYSPGDTDTIEQLGIMARAAGQVVSHVAMDKSFMASVDKLLTATTQKNADRADELWQSLLEDNARKLVPFSGAMNSVTNATDPNPRATGGDGIIPLWDSMKAHLPFLSQGQPPRRDLIGRPVVNADDYWWNPFSGGPESHDPAMQELASVAAQVRVPPRTLDGFTLDAKQYDELITRSTQATIFPGGKNLEGYLRDQTTSPYWKQMGNTADGGVEARTQLVQRAVDSAYRYGTVMFQKANPDFTAAAQKRQQQKAANFIAPQQADIASP